MSLQNSHQISDVKVMLVKGIDGNGIASIEKTSSQGLVDVYTITYTNGERSTFTVTNGAGGGMSALIMISSDAGSDVSVVAPSGRVLQVEQVSGSSTLWQCETTEYGTHNIFSVLSDDEVQVNLNVDACKIYTVDESHFHADITVTYPSGATCSCGQSGETPEYATDNPFTFTVHSAGTYVVTVTNGLYTVTENVVITTNAQTESLNVSLIPDGATVTPTDDVSLLLYCADIWDKNYTNISEVLADSTTLSAIIADSNAVDYLVRSTTWATTVCSNQSAMTTIGLNNYASNTLSADDTWRDAIGASAYKTSVWNKKVPAMTSNNAPSGVCFGANGYSGQSNYYIAFNGSEGDGDGFRINVGGRIGYQFTQSLKVYQVRANCKYYSPSENPAYAVKSVSVEGTNDRSNFTTLKTIEHNNNTRYVDFTFNPQNAYSGYSLKVNSNYGGLYSAFLEIYFYGRVDV